MTAALAGARPAPRQFKLAQKSDINVTPFVDVMLVLLIIFMVVAPLATTTIRLDLPRAAPGSGRPLVLTISGDGAILLSDQALVQPVTLDGLAGALAAKGGANPAAQQVFLRAAPHVRYGRFMEVMNRLQESGYYHVGLVSEAVRS